MEPHKNKFSEWITILFILVCAIAIIALLIIYKYEAAHPSTEDAYVFANTVTIAPTINGTIENVAISNYQLVKKGQVLINLDEQQSQLLVNQAKYQLDIAQQKISAIRSALRDLSTELSDARKQHNSLLEKSRRLNLLIANRQAPASAQDTLNASLISSNQGISALQDKQHQLISESGYNDKLSIAENPAVKAAAAELTLAELKLKQTKIVAPADGLINNLHINVGDTVAAGTPLCALIKTDQWKIIANFKETQLQHIEINDPVDIILEMYPHVKYHGYIKSISQSSSDSFSLLPTQNTNGNWVKIIQRFPVEIVFIDPDPQHPLRMGASAKVTVNPRG